MSTLSPTYLLLHPPISTGAWVHLGGETSRDSVLPFNQLLQNLQRLEAATVRTRGVCPNWRVFCDSWMRHRGTSLSDSVDSRPRPRLPPSLGA